MRFMPEIPPTLPGMSTQRSRGMDSTVIVLAAGSKRATMVTSLRWPPASASLPISLDRVGLSPTNALESEPTSSMLKGWPGAAGWATRCLAWIFLIWPKR